MATNYVVPQLRIFQEFTETLSGSTASMGACMLGPCYTVKTNESLGEYDGTSRVEEYPGLGGSDTILSADLSSFSARVVDADLVKLTISSPDYTSNVLTTDNLLADSATVSVPAGLPRFQVGDKVRFSYANSEDEVVTITGFSADGAITEYAGDVSVSGGQTLSVTVGTLTFTNPKHFVGTVTSAFKVGTDATASFTVVDSDGVVVKQHTGAISAPISLGNGLSITFTALQSWFEGDTFAFSVVPEIICNNIATLSTAPTEGATSAELIQTETVNLPASTLTFGTSSITIPSSMTYNGQEIVGGDVQVSFRAKNSAYSDGLFTCGTIAEAEELFGDVTSKNPLGMMVAKGLANSNRTAINFIAVTEESAEGYSAALDILDEDKVVYGVVPFTTDEAILASIQERINLMSGPTQMNWKTGWFAYDIPTTTVSADSTLSGGAITLVGNGTKTVGVASTDLGGIKVGDKVVSGRLEALVTGVNVLASSVTLNKTVPSGNHTPAVFYRAPSAAEKVSLAKSACLYNDHRIRLIVTPGVASSSAPTEIISNAYVAAACAGYRSGVAPHQPLTRATLTGFVIPSMGGLSATSLDEMAGSGIWLVVRNTLGEVFIRHQLTTDTDHYELREDSRMCNADEISRFIREQLEDYYGRANISDEFINALYVKLLSATAAIRARTYSAQLGPQILTAEAPVIERDPEMADRLRVHLEYTTPYPANNIDVYLTIG